MMNKNMKDDKRSIEWIIDSGAFMHMCNDRNAFISFSSIETQHLTTVWKLNLEANIAGSVICSISQHKIIFNDVLYVPQLRYNVLSVSALIHNGYSVTFSMTEAQIKISSTGAVVGIAQIDNGIYKLRCDLL